MMLGRLGILFVPNGVHLGHFQPRLTRAEARAQYGFEDGRWLNLVNTLAPSAADAAIITITRRRRTYDLAAAIQLEFVRIKDVIQQHERGAGADRQMHCHGHGGDDTFALRDHGVENFERLHARSDAPGFTHQAR